jgi:hypothetical protein
MMTLALSPTRGGTVMRRPAARLIVLLAMLATAVVATAAPAAANTWTDVYIVTITAPRCVDAPNSALNAHMLAAPCADDANQLWTLTLSGGYYIIVNLGTGLCLANGGTLPGAPVEQNSCIGATWEQWTLTSNGSNRYSISNRGAALCMVPQNGLPNAPVVLATCSASPTWQLLS